MVSPTCAQLVQLTDRVWYLPHDEPTDRPVLGYVRGDRLSLAVDAGASPAHVADFYRALASEGLRLPDLTAITHWHWDHAFGMASVRGLTVACRATNELLAAERVQAEEDPTYWDGMRRDTKGFCLEFPAGGAQPAIEASAVQFEESLDLDLGGAVARLRRVEAPHTPDSVLVHVPGERVLFLGDAACSACGVLDHAKLAALSEAVREADCLWYLHGHWAPLDAEGIAEDFDPARTE